MLEIRIDPILVSRVYHCGQVLMTKAQSDFIQAKKKSARFGQFWPTKKKNQRKLDGYFQEISEKVSVCHTELISEFRKKYQPVSILINPKDEELSREMYTLKGYDVKVITKRRGYFKRGIQVTEIQLLISPSDEMLRYVIEHLITCKRFTRSTVLPNRYIVT